MLSTVVMLESSFWLGLTALVKQKLLIETQ